MDFSDLEYLNMRKMAAKVISSATGIENLEQVEAGLELTVCNVLGLEFKRKYPKNTMYEKKSLFDMISDYALHPDEPTMLARWEFVDKNRENLVWGTDIAKILPYGLAIAAGLLLLHNPIIALVAYTSMLATNFAKKPIDSYLNSQMNKKQMKEQLPDLRQSGKEGYKIFFELYSRMSKNAPSQTPAHEYLT